MSWQSGPGRVENGIGEATPVGLTLVGEAAPVGLRKVSTKRIRGRRRGRQWGGSGDVDEASSVGSTKELVQMCCG